MTMNQPATKPKPLSPQDLASQLFDLVIQLPEVKSDPREAARQVILFLQTSLVYAAVSSTTDDTARKALLKSIGDAITGALDEPPATK
jgi:hypothetical protein